ncbi:MAG: hypothetical protein PHN88_14745 [Ignavibacteria bacterium]|nr:hypothetical protein [Ignavibacteria bacterium]
MKINKILGGLTAALVETASFVPRFFSDRLKRSAEDKHAEKNGVMYDTTNPTPKKHCLLCGRSHSHHNAYCCADHARIYQTALTTLRKYKHAIYIPYGATSKLFAMFMPGNSGKIGGFYNKTMLKVVLREYFPKIVIPDVIGG